MTSSDKIVIGVRPGPMAGITGIRYGPHKVMTAAPVIGQWTSNAVLPVLRSLIPADRFVTIAYVTSTSPARVAKILDRKLCDALGTLVSPLVAVVPYLITEVVAWATDERLAAIGVYDITFNMRPARDSARVALYAAHAALRIPDPLARRRKEVSAV
jgi:hypothetical protein